MGLDTSHDCWHGAYSAFHRWRMEVARIARIPLPLMEGFYGGWATPEVTGELARFLPIPWDAYKSDPLCVILNHSDCEGEIPWEQCSALADRLAEIIPELPQEPDYGHIRDWREKTQLFIDGLRAAAAAHENVEFH